MILGRKFLVVCGITHLSKDLPKSELQKKLLKMGAFCNFLPFFSIIFGVILRLWF